MNKKILNIMTERNITPMDLAEAFDCTRGYVCEALMEADVFPGKIFLKRLADYLNISIDELTMIDWGKQEIDTLNNLYAESSRQEILNALPRRKWDDIKTKANELGLKRAKHPRLYTSGYIKIYKPEHHRANNNGYVLEHIAVYEETHNTRIPVGYHIHHIDGNKTNNIPSNLMLLSNREHMLLHQIERKQKEIDAASTPIEHDELSKRFDKAKENGTLPDLILYEWLGDLRKTAKNIKNLKGKK